MVRTLFRRNRPDRAGREAEQAAGAVLWSGDGRIFPVTGYFQGQDPGRADGDAPAAGSAPVDIDGEGDRDGSRPDRQRVSSSCFQVQRLIFGPA